MTRSAARWSRVADLLFGALLLLPALFGQGWVDGAHRTGLPWHVAPAFLLFGFIGLRDPSWLWPALGASTAWGLGVRGPVWPMIAAICLLAMLRTRGSSPDQRRLALALVAVGALLAAKQLVASSVLPAAALVAPWAALVCAASAGAVLAARSGAGASAGLIGVGCVLFARLGLVYADVGAHRLRAAADLDAVALVYQDLAEALCDARAATCPDPDERSLARELVRVAPDRDHAALRLGWRESLSLGWRPQRADGAQIDVARALESAGRGGEALRLLARHPREGEVDALRALLERLQGRPVLWRGARLGGALPGALPMRLEFATDGWHAVEFTATEALPNLHITGEGSPYDGPPVVEVTLDNEPVVGWRVDGVSTIELPGPIELGPHRLGLRFVNDRSDAGGDRNVLVTRVW